MGACAIALVLCATPVLEKFKPLAAPIDKLEAMECAAVSINELEGPLPLARDPALVPTDESSELLFAACGRLKLSDSADGLIVRVKNTHQAGEQTVFRLVAIDRGGKSLCAAGLSSAYGSEAGSSTPQTRLSKQKDGWLLETNTDAVYPLYDVEGVEQIDVVRRSRAVLRMPGCKIETGTTTYRDRSGLFKDQKSGELLLIAGKQVFYRASQDKNAIALTVVQFDDKAATLQFPKSAKNYLLTFDAGGESIVCQNPDGTKQTFKRTF